MSLSLWLVFLLEINRLIFYLSVFFSEVFKQVGLFVEHLLHFMNIDKSHLSSPLRDVCADEYGV